MDGENDGAKAQGAAQAGAQEEGVKAAQAQATGGSEAVDDTDKAREEFEAALAERDAKIAALEGEIAEAAKTAESAERLRAEMDELRRQGDEQCIGFELQIAGARNVKAARALLGDYGNDIEKLKAAEPWLFGAGAAAPAQTGATGLPNAGAASDEGATVKRWRKIAGIEGDEE